jgi:hypothetical protein
MQRLEASPIARKGRKPSSSDVSERRRQQNRISQIAFRQRNKMTIERLREDLNQSLEANEALCDTMQDMLGKMDDLKKSVEDVLASRLRRLHRELSGYPG